MISDAEVSASYRHISLKIPEKFPEVLERVSFELGQQKSQFRISMQTPVENPLMTIDTRNREVQALAEAKKELGLKTGAIVTWLDEDPSIEGIAILPAWKWLLTEGKEP